MKKYIIGCLLFCMVVLGLTLSNPPEVSARIKLATLPLRDKVAIQLDNQTVTLVEEERVVPLLKSTIKRGNNHVDFSWSSTRIDKSSVLMRVVGIRKGGEFEVPKKIDIGGKMVDEVSVINVSYPPNENALVWEVFANDACAAKIRVSYLISNLNRSFSYRARASKDEKTIEISQHMLINNFSGESYDEAQLWAGFGNRFSKELNNNSQLKLLMHKYKQAKVEKVYKYDWYAHGSLNDEKPFASRVMMFYRLKNDKDNGMGLFPLQPGKVRIFIDDGHEGEAFLGEDRVGIVPIDDKADLFLGDARDVVCTRTIDSKEKNKKMGKELFDLDITIKYEIENFKKQPCKLRIREDLIRLVQEHFGNTHGDVEWKAGKKTTEGIVFEYEEGGSYPTLIVDLSAAPEDPDTKVEKKVFYFHLNIENLWN